ncbi:NADH-quinone oxidoreductase subunit L [Aquicella lusitana]|uniref:NADH dehydrogenase subunit L n=2 Tax=Aquicella lusitana TaxID=254246 RepID=A0A370GT95_9COXI|nr:NADH dehydrogenase subunit L [Aquicella lusitana]VVC73809.1 NADH-quinone oxidoreductase subunit L [Aquicella lusitana]
MENPLIWVALLMTLLPLAGSLLAGLLGKALGRVWTHRIVITLVGISFLLSCYLFKVIVLNGHPSVQDSFYTWATAGMLRFDVAFLLDRLSATMAMIVLFVSFMVHIYTIGYMADDPGYQRFFSYVSLFTFAMLMLVLANNFLLLFFGWEGVGLVSYLLIGFWFKREAAVFGSLKAFLANRVGDIGFILATAMVLMYFDSLTYTDVFRQVPLIANRMMEFIPGYSVPVVTMICFLLFVGAMGKSAQVPLHVWLPESMEGPTPISALIHAATMVTAGIYMVARMSPLFEFSPAALTFILVIGGTTAFFMGLVAVVQYDIKRVIAYSTLSQLGYMAVALGASAYDAAIFHLITHAFFKALLFLAAGSVIIALHHEQDMRKMGGLAAYMPITYITFVIGSLALCAIPPFSGFYSKDIIIEAVKLSTVPGAGYAYLCVLAGAFVTPLYMFRALFMTFHTNERMDPQLRGHVKESPWVVLVPLIALAIPSLVAGQLLIGPMLFAPDNLLGNSIFVLPEHNVLNALSTEYPGAKLMALEAGKSLTFWFAIAGIFTAWLFTAGVPQWSRLFKERFAWVYAILVRKYGFDDFNQIVLVHGTQDAGHVCYEVSDVKMIDTVCVNGSGRFIQWLARVSRRMQTGYIYHYALAMVLGILVFLVWYMVGF